MKNNKNRMSNIEEFRCEKCGKLLAKEEILYGQIEIKCYACNHYNIYRFVASMFTADPVLN